MGPRAAEGPGASSGVEGNIEMPRPAFTFLGGSVDMLLRLEITSGSPNVEAAKHADSGS